MEHQAYAIGEKPVSSRRELRHAFSGGKYPIHLHGDREHTTKGYYFLYECDSSKRSVLGYFAKDMRLWLYTLVHSYSFTLLFDLGVVLGCPRQGFDCAKR